MSPPARSSIRRFTRAGLLLLATGGACFPLALVTGSLALVLLGSLLVALVITRPTPVARLTVQRDGPTRVTEGDRVTFTTRVTDTLGAAPVFIDPDAPDDADVEESTHRPARGHAERVTTFVPRTPGARVWEDVTVRYQDPWGLVEIVTRLPVTGALHVLPAPSFLAAGRRTGAKHEVGSKDRALIGGDFEPEVERLREYRAGDRLRDIDWAHSTKVQSLISRELRREAPRPIVVLLDASATMRVNRRHMMLASASRAALGVLAAAQASRVPAGLVAWSERGVEAVVRASTTRRAVTEALLRVSELPASIVTRRTPAPVTREHAPHGGPVDEALASVARASSVPSLVIAFVDAEHEPALARTLLSRLTRRGHRVLLVAPANGPHHYAVRDVSDGVARRLAEWWRNRAVVERAAETLHVPFVSLGPHVDARVVEEVVLSAR